MQTAAYAQDPGDAVALNSLATYYLHKWFPLPMRAPARGLVEGQARVPVQADGSGRYGGYMHDVCSCGSVNGTYVIIPHIYTYNTCIMRTQSSLSKATSSASARPSRRGWWRPRRTMARSS